MREHQRAFERELMIRDRRALVEHQVEPSARAARSARLIGHASATRRQRLPEVIKFLLRLAVHDERDGIRKRKAGPAIHADELLAVQLKGDRRNSATTG